jgi:uncharacterized membrane protein YsdA (DUF1294 family)
LGRVVKMAKMSLSESRPAAHRGVSPYKLYGGVAAALALAIGATFWWLFGLSLVVVWIAALGTATFLMYGLDKLQARRSGLRVPENILHLLALIGGAIGGWAGMLAFRHKTRHPLFYVVLGLGTIVDLALLRYLI